jgi:hypothetical protein
VRQSPPLLLAAALWAAASGRPRGTSEFGARNMSAEEKNIGEKNAETVTKICGNNF